MTVDDLRNYLRSEMDYTDSDLRGLKTADMRKLVTAALED